MLDYLLAEKNFVSLKHYIDLMNALPDVLAQVEKFSASFERSGHQMLRSPDAEALRQVAVANACSWQVILMMLPQLGALTAQTVQDLETFSREFRQMSADPVNRKRPLSQIDPQQFSIVRSPGWAAPPRDMMDVMREMDARLERCKQSVMQFKETARDVGETVHSIFVRFIECLGLPICACHDVGIKIEVYYALGRLGLPNMQYNPEDQYSEEQRRQIARDHLDRLNGLRRTTGSAVNNLSDFCYRMAYMLNEAGRELGRSFPAQKLETARYSWNLVRESISEVQSMSEQLIELSKRRK
ncbi:hypothetical protein [Pseudomonas sp. SDO52101_S400]